MADQIEVLTALRGPIKFAKLSETQVLSPFNITASSISVPPDWQGKMVRFTGACTVTIPATLPEDFLCGWSQEGAGVVTFVAGAGATLQSFEGKLKSAGQYAIGGITGIGPGIFRLYGQMTA